ncbi:Uncharacterized protein TCM_019810 [Theobroma cacao]|uniref:Uncharacterized protein n=1 Tax=Theobroma cacao TaxID=3641 RepID=A0A061EJK4_THECC|nr:Uncharacterized protein TCM_019810 [Theobroma cacao]
MHVIIFFFFCPLMRTNVKLQVSNNTWQVKMANHPEYARLLSRRRKFSLQEEDVRLNLSGYHLQKQRQRDAAQWPYKSIFTIEIPPTSHLASLVSAD